MKGPQLQEIPRPPSADIYTKEAATMFGVLPSEVTFTQRQTAKAAIFRAMYDAHYRELPQ